MKREELIIFLEWYSKYRERGFDAKHIEYIADLYLSALPDEKKGYICIENANCAFNIDGDCSQVGGICEWKQLKSNQP